MKYYTDNGVEITPGLRVFTNDWSWGTVLPEQFTSGGMCEPGGEYFNGWFKVKIDDDTEYCAGATKTYDGQRITTVAPPKRRLD